MPKKTGNKRTAQRTRSNTYWRKDQKKPGCQASDGSKPKCTKIISNSLFALTLPVKKGYETCLEDLGVFESPFPEIIQNLLSSLNRGLQLKKLPILNLEKGMSSNAAFELIVSKFKKHILPNGYEFNIEKEHSGGNYFFLVYKDFYLPWFWHEFPIHPVYSYLQDKKKPELAQLFIKVIGLLIKRAGFAKWDNGNLYAFDMIIGDEGTFLDHMSNDLERAETEEEHSEIEATWYAMLHTYTKGEAFEVSQYLKRNNFSLKTVEKKVKLFRQPKAVVTWMRAAVDFLKSSFVIEDFSYDSQDYEQYMEGAVPFDQQVMIMWDTDMFFDIASEYMDADASNNGVKNPCLFTPVAPWTKKLNIPSDSDAKKWLAGITHLYQQYNKLLKFLKK